MKKMKKILAMLLALTMVLGMSLTSMAASKPEAKDTATATIQGILEENATIKVYQIVDADYTAEGFVGYVLDNGLTTADIADIYNPTYTEIMAISKKTSLTEYTALEDAENATNVIWTKSVQTAATETEPAVYQYTATLEAGMYLVEIVGTGAVVYNPMIISIGYDAEQTGDSNTLKPGSVDATSNWKLNDAVVAAKSSEIDLTKSGTDSTPETTGDTDDTDVKVGDAVDYTITTTIPSYSEEYETVTFNVTDTLVNGLTYLDAKGTKVDPVVKVNGTAISSPNYTLTWNGSADAPTGFTVAFNSTYVKGLAGKTIAERAVVITYQAYVTDAAITSAANNKVELEYTHKPGEETLKKEAVELVNTVEIDGVVKKEDENGNALVGAKFGLYTTYDATNNEVSELVGEYTTVAGGDIYFGGLDADDTYYLKEISAPAGYSLNDTVYTITFVECQYNAITGALESYKVSVSYVDENGTTKTVNSAAITYGGEGTSPVVNVPNTKLNALPSTGGIGTTIFTVAGCGIMIAAAFFFFASRKKES